MIKKITTADWEKVIQIEANRDLTISMHSNAPCNAEEFLSSRSIAALLWPTKSPGINPIEFCWRVLKQKVYKRQNTT